MPAPAARATVRCRRGSGWGACARPRSGLRRVWIPTPTIRTRTSGRKTRCGSRVAQAAPPAAPASAVSAIGAAVRRSGRTRRAYVSAAVAVPATLESLFVASTCAGPAAGRPMSSAGSWTSPPPPTTASTQPATSAATTSRATVAGPACPGRSNHVTCGSGSPRPPDHEATGSPRPPDHRGHPLTDASGSMTARRHARPDQRSTTGRRSRRRWMTASGWTSTGTCCAGGMSECGTSTARRPARWAPCTSSYGRSPT